MEERLLEAKDRVQVQVQIQGEVHWAVRLGEGRGEPSREGGGPSLGQPGALQARPPAPRGSVSSRTCFAFPRAPEAEALRARERHLCGSPLARRWVRVPPTEVRGLPGGMWGSPSPKALGAPAWHSCLPSPRDICAHHRGAVSMPIPVGGKEAVGAVETWAPDSSGDGCHRNSRLSSLNQKRQAEEKIATVPVLNWTPSSSRPRQGQARGSGAREPCGAGPSRPHEGAAGPSHSAPREKVPGVSIQSPGLPRPCPGP